jgi:hypothetical protein
MGQRPTSSLAKKKKIFGGVQRCSMTFVVVCARRIKLLRDVLKGVRGVNGMRSAKEEHGTRSGAGNAEDTRINTASLPESDADERR